MNRDIHKLTQSIITVRKQRGLTQEQLGKLIGVKKSQVCRIEKSEELTFSTIMKIIKALNIEVILTSEGITIKSII